MTVFFFMWFFMASLWTVNALRAPRLPGDGFPPLWLPGMLISELAPLYFVARALIAWAFISLGAGRGGLGAAGVVLFALSELGLVVIIVRSVLSARATGHSPGSWTLLSLAERVPKGVEVTPEVEYDEGLTLDVYSRPGRENAPTLIYVHPGSWMRGRPGRQARALFHRLAQKGWVILDIRYPLSPAATFPAHLIGVKRAIHWAKTVGQEWGVDPSQIAISGGSSGAHLAALAALTADDSGLQPGFESADTSVSGCVAFYGIYDLLVRNPTRYDWPFIARYVLKAEVDESPDLYRLGSPIDQVHPAAPPFLLVHGQYDSIVLPSESEHFAGELRSQGVPVEFFEVSWAQHGFDAIRSLRSRAVADMCVDWLDRRVTDRP